MDMDAAGVLHLKAIDSINSASTLQLSHVEVHSGSIRNTLLEDVTLHKVKSLEVKGSTELLAETLIGGSLTVHGTVMGSGPYVDSSDVRFKKDIRPLTSVLSSMLQLRGVSVCRGAVMSLTCLLCRR